MGDNNPYADTITDMDSVPTGHYSFWWADNSTPANFPNITTSAGKVRAFVEIYNVANGYIYERVVNVYPYPNVDNRLEIFERFKGGATISWTPWWRNDNYGTTSLSELASALGGSLKERLVMSFDYETCKTWGAGLYFLFGDDTTNGDRYALVYVAHHSDGYAVVPIGDTADFGTNASQYNLLYQINSDGVKFRTGSSLPCYIKKLM